MIVARCRHATNSVKVLHTFLWQNLFGESDFLLCNINLAIHVFLSLRASVEKYYVAHYIIYVQLFNSRTNFKTK